MASFDYVIVGAGAAGCVLAARLTEDPDVRVLLLEAGPPDTADQIHIPVTLAQLAKSKYDWDYVTEPEPQLDSRRCYLPRGRTLGGSTSINVMVYIRGNRADYDDWEAMGATGWGWRDVFPYFKRAEDNERGLSADHGAGGPLSVSEGRNPNILSDAFVTAAQARGLAFNPDFNGPEQDGVGYYQLMQRNGARCSAAIAYLHPAMSRPNLTVETGAYATRILLDGTRATGVECDHGAELQQHHAEREVLVCAGAYNSPHLLMLSGIGPAAQLSLFAIPPVVDLPVGENLQDHPLTVLSWLTDTDSLMSAAAPENLELFLKEGRGPLTSNIAQVGGFVRTDPVMSAPDLQLYSAPVMYYEEGLGAVVDHAVSIAASLLHPTSRGRVVLRSPVPSAKARILHNYYATGQDRRSMLDGLRLILEIAAQQPLSGHIRAPHTLPASGDEAALLDYMQRATQTTYHPTSTCAIGQVVDPELRVLGMEGLRVIDASVMPAVVGGNTTAPTIMIAEKAADLIRRRAATAGVAGHEIVGMRQDAAVAAHDRPAPQQP